MSLKLRNSKTILNIVILRMMTDKGSELLKTKINEFDIFKKSKFLQHILIWSSYTITTSFPQFVTSHFPSVLGYHFLKFRHSWKLTRLSVRNSYIWLHFKRLKEPNFRFRHNHWTIIFFQNIENLSSKVWEILFHIIRTTHKKFDKNI